MKRTRLQGWAVKQYGHWIVVETMDIFNPIRFIVVDTSTRPPVRVHGPTTLADAHSHADSLALLWAAVYGQTPQ